MILEIGENLKLVNIVFDIYLENSKKLAIS